MDQVLEGVLVVSLEQAVAAPFASRKLADLGARVIKIEREGGDFARRYDSVAHGQSSYFVWLNHGKESLTLDLKDPDDAALLQRIVERADVFIQNLAPGAAARAGFGSAELRERLPRLIACDISGYGEEGPFARMKAYDNLVQAETGLLAVTGTPETPSRVGISLCDIGAGMHAYAAILQALLHRDRTGEGAHLRVSLFDALADWMAVPLLHQVYGGAPPPRSGAHHPSIAPYGPYAAGDGRSVLLSIQNEREWVRFCETVLRRPELAEREDMRTNDLRVEHRDRLDEEIRSALADVTLEEFVDRLEAAGIAFGRLNSVADFAKHPQLRLQEIDSAHGPIRLPADPVRVSGGRRMHGDRRSRVPEAGEHSAAIRQEFAA